MLGSLLASCMSVSVESLSDHAYPARDAAIPIESLSIEPTRPHLDLALITVSSANASTDALRRKIQDRAHTLGADAVVLGPAGTLVSMAHSPYYEPGLFGPAGAAFGLYGYGWYTPYASNPYLLTQGAIDQPRMDRFLSGVAIRYLEEPDHEASQ